uniref:Uncharacterized protein n=1 Tax=Rhizophora mucronata TaxID=61149 RepID=A0A2P2QAM5_RHIMU
MYGNSKNIKVICFSFIFGLIYKKKKNYNLRQI